MHTVDSNEAVVDVIPSLFRVRVTVRRGDSGLLLGNLFGIGSTAISTYAAAEAVDAGGSGCVMPFAIPDIWGDANDDTNGNRMEDGDEEWNWDEGTDSYVPFDPDVVDPNQTGYGSDYRNGYGDLPVDDDFGRQVILKPQSPHDNLGPGNFQLWGFDGDNNGSPGIAARIRGCDPRNVNLGEEDAYHVIPGNRVGPVAGAVRDRIALDPNAVWNPVDQRRGRLERRGLAQQPAGGEGRAVHPGPDRRGQARTASCSTTSACSSWRASRTAAARTTTSWADSSTTRAAAPAAVPPARW